MDIAYNNVSRRFVGYDKYCSARSMFVENRTDILVRVYVNYYLLSVKNGRLIIIPYLNCYK